MTVKKAIQVLDWWINHKKETIEKLRKDWNIADIDKTTGTEKTIFDAEKTEIYNLEVIKKELVPDCNHPKEWHDIDGTGQKYCTGCNLDL